MNLQPNSSPIGPPVSTASLLASPINATTKQNMFEKYRQIVSIASVGTNLHHLQVYR